MILIASSFLLGVCIGGMVGFIAFKTKPMGPMVINEELKSVFTRPQKKKIKPRINTDDVLAIKEQNMKEYLGRPIH